MKSYIVEYGTKTKKVEATNPLSACKKAFRSPEGYHWESTNFDDAQAMVTNGENFKIELACQLIDHG
jgi:hypothetical protein